MYVYINILVHSRLCFCIFFSFDGFFGGRIRSAVCVNAICVYFVSHFCSLCFALLSFRSKRCIGFSIWRIFLATPSLSILFNTQLMSYRTQNMTLFLFICLNRAVCVSKTVAQAATCLCMCRSVCLWFRRIILCMWFRRIYIDIFCCWCEIATAYTKLIVVNA